MASENGWGAPRIHGELLKLFVVPTATFRLLFVWFAIGHARRRVLHCSVKEFPTSSWVIQQLREALPFDRVAHHVKYLLLDRDSIFSADVIHTAASMALNARRTSYQSPGRTASPSAWWVQYAGNPGAES
jgi:hypothetical protein